VRLIFGPVASRRLKRSLGVDLVPYKTCSFDCVYCELGTTTILTIERNEYVPTQELLAQLQQRLAELSTPPDYITLGGSGEPTLHSGIGRLISEIRRLTSIPTAVLTNSSLLFREDVRQDLVEVDVVLPSLDAVTPEIFQRINRPHPCLDPAKIVQGLKEFRKVFRGQMWLEILFVQGINDTPEEVAELQRALAEIAPDKVHLNTIDRPPAEEGFLPLTPQQLEHLAQRFGPKAEIITSTLLDNRAYVRSQGKTMVIELLKRRPCTLDDISLALQMDKAELAPILEVLSNEGIVSSREFNNQRFFKVG
jgi:wyosine [tRNA(Phe)-imidazoG37] synthetase (radical SAM superfamily)